MKKLTLLLTSLLLASSALANNSTESLSDCTPFQGKPEAKECFEENRRICTEQGRTYTFRGGVECGEPCTGNTPYLFFGICVSRDRIDTFESQRPGSVQIACNDGTISGGDICERHALDLTAEICNDRLMVYNEESRTCEFCPRDSGFVINNECRKCPDDYSWQSVHGRCLPFAELGVYCNNAHGKVYSPKTDACESACLDGRTPDSNSVCR